MTDNFSTSSQVSPELKDQELEFLNSIFDLARNNKPIALQSLLDQGIPVNLTNSHGDTLLILAAYHEHEEIVRVLLKAGADPDRLNDRGQTALVCAVFRDNLTISQCVFRYTNPCGCCPVLRPTTYARTSCYGSINR